MAMAVAQAIGQLERQRAVPEAERVFGARGVDAGRDHDAVLADVEAVDQQRHARGLTWPRMDPGDTADLTAFLAVSHESKRAR